MVKKNRNLSDEDIQEVAKEAYEYSGAEIEAAVDNALWKVFQEKGAITKEALIESLKETKPLSDVMSTEVTNLREMAKGRFRYASSAVDAQVKAEASQTLEVEVE